MRRKKKEKEKKMATTSVRERDQEEERDIQVHDERWNDLFGSSHFHFRLIEKTCSFLNQYQDDISLVKLSLKI